MTSLPIRPIVQNQAEAKEDVPDLSYISQPIGDLFGSLPTDPSSYTQYQLDAEQIQFYKENGYLINIKVLSEEQCDRILEDYKKFLLWDQNDITTQAGSMNDAHRISHPGMHLFHEFHSNQTNDPDNVLSHMLGHWRITPLFHDLVFHPAITVPSSQLLASANSDGRSMVPVQFWHDQLFAKPPHHGANVAWHQDYSYWTRTIPMNHMTVHIALDEQTLENGTLHFIPKSHKWTRDNGHPLPVTDFDFKDMESIKTILTAEEKEQFKPVPSLLKKGYASFHHPLMVHGSYPNRTSLPRRAAVVNYFGQGTKSNTDEPLLLNVPVIKKGELITGRFFPLVFDPAWLEAK
ncbi:unnamed protein product [Didymodactylos carnosus]|uniref:Phytanoyl-CoA dioxygenase n=1 Tax=Didymodactylos carnosus TaxID=1234261 RepID=A0A813NN63_9BILA|nr:unnamed protein product [Didymodactylos carnosus]CAF3518927.1 unnamed protein product [Didymodactylos carnosus]